MSGRTLARVSLSQSSLVLARGVRTSAILKRKAISRSWRLILSFPGKDCDGVELFAAGGWSWQCLFATASRPRPG